MGSSDFKSPASSRVLRMLCETERSASLQRLGWGHNDRRIGIRPSEEVETSHVQTSSEVHSATRMMGNGGKTIILLCPVPKFSVAFVKLIKATISFVMSVRPSVRNNSTAAVRIFMKSYIWAFSKFCREKSSSSNFDNNNRYFTWIPTYINSGIVLNFSKNRTVSDKVVEKIKTHFMFNNYFPKIMSFMR